MVDSLRHEILLSWNAVFENREDRSTTDFGYVVAALARARDDDGANAPAAAPSWKTGGSDGEKGGGGKGGGPNKDGGSSNTAPTDLTLSSGTVAENSAAGTQVGKLSADDSDKRESFTYTLLDDAEGRFVIDGNTVKVAPGAELDYESATSHEILVRVTDKAGNTYEEAFTIAVSDIDETPIVQEETPYYVEAILAGDAYRWNAGDSVGTSVTLTFGFLDAVPDYYSTTATERNNFGLFNEQQREATRAILDDIEAFANISFVETTGDNAQITYGNAALGSGIGAWAYYPSTYYEVGGDVWINNQYGSQLSPDASDYAYLTMIHETGHALGLAHPGDYDANAGGSGELYLPVDEENRQYTVMSYDGHPNMGNVEPQTMMLYDIAALQHLYGANTSHALGDDVYALSGSHNLGETIWDAGGYDELDASAELNRVVLDLRDGHFSSVGTYGSGGLAANNIAIAFDAVIEAAAGGAGDDWLTGNEVANRLSGGGGNDSLLGGMGADVLEGGAGADQFVFDFGWGSDTVTDFEDGLDQLVFTDTGLSFVDMIISYDGDNAFVTDGQNEILFVSVADGALGQEDFFFA